MLRIFICYALSGFVSLGYQVAWFRIFTDWFGSTNLTFVLVVANFIGGLAVGAIISQRLSATLAVWFGCRRKLQIYGLLEIFVALGVLLTFLANFIPADIWGHFPYQEQDGIWSQAIPYRLFQSLVAALCVFLPCLFMGATFPLLCEKFSPHHSSERFPSALYAWNTLGACTGVLACQFILLPGFGHYTTLWLMVAANFLLGLYFLLAPDLLPVATSEKTSTQPEPNNTEPNTPGNWSVLLACAALSGFLSGALEGDFFKRISFLIALNPGATMSFISFWAILGIFLASTLVNRLTSLRFMHIKIAFLIALLYCGGIWLYSDAIMDFIQNHLATIEAVQGLTPEGMNSRPFPSALIQLLAFVGILVFPPYCLVSLLLPYICNHLHRHPRSLGMAYGLNTLAFCIGLVCFTLLAPLVNIFFSLKLFLIIFAVVVGWLFTLSYKRPVNRWQFGALPALIIGACLLPSTGFDHSFFTNGSIPARHPVRALKSNGSNTTFVVDVEGNSRLFFGRLQMSGTHLRAQSYMQLMAHFPMLLHPQPKRALLLCLGVGNTGAAIAAHDSIERIDIIDLNEQIFATLPEFSDTSNDLHNDPRLRLIHDDGRNFLNLTDQRYDLITSEPPPPLAAGVYRLYSREYYQSALDHLTPKGLMTQWLPVFLMSPESVAMAISTFLDVFPETFLFTGFGTDFILVGSRSSFDFQRIEERFYDSPTVTKNLSAFGIKTPTDLMARIVQSDAQLREIYGAKPQISDTKNNLDTMFLDPINRPVIAYNPLEVANFVATHSTGDHSNLHGIITHLGRLRYHVHGFPFESLSTVGDQSNVALADTDWPAISQLHRMHAQAISARRPDVSIRLLQEILSISPEQPDALLLLAQRYLQQRRYTEGINLVDRFQKLEPDVSLGYQLKGQLYRRNGEPEKALAEFRIASQLDPEAFKPLSGMAWIMATHPDELRNPDEALRLAKRADALAGGTNVDVLETLAAAYAANGQFQQAKAIVIKALNDFRGNRRFNEKRFNKYLEIYTQGKAVVVQPGN